MALPRIEKCSSSDSSVSYLTAQLSQLDRNQRHRTPHYSVRSAHNAHTVLCVQVFVGRCIRMRLTACGSGYRRDVGAYRRGRYNCPVLWY